MTTYTNETKTAAETKTVSKPSMVRIETRRKYRKEHNV